VNERSVGDSGGATHSFGGAKAFFKKKFAILFHKFYTALPKKKEKIILSYLGKLLLSILKKILRRHPI
jgi:hypothetical protein